MGQDASQPVRLPPSHFLPLGPPSSLATTPTTGAHGAVAGGGGTPPPGCPMHQPSSSSSSIPLPPPPPPPPTKPKPIGKLPPPGCPMHDPSNVAPAVAGASSSSSSSGGGGGGGGGASCPIDHTALASSSSSRRPAGSSSSEASSAEDALSPLNMMPSLAQVPLSASQQTSLSTSREVSSIKRTLSSDEDPTIPASSPLWVYPSAQQFYNALVKKGFETAEEDVDSMVFVHNVLNEVAWKQVLEWEAKRKGKTVEEEMPEAELCRFKGRPGTLSPKARYYLFMGNLFPDSYNTEPPFDRHDWVVRRPSTNSEHRYIIDYYSAPSDPDGSPNFNLDVRPALDDLDAVGMRMRAFVEEFWGGSAGASGGAGGGGNKDMA